MKATFQTLQNTTPTVLVSQSVPLVTRFGADKPPQRLELKVLQPHETSPPPPPPPIQAGWRKLYKRFIDAVGGFLYSISKLVSSSQRVTTKMDKARIEKLYNSLESAHDKARKMLGRDALTLSEKILFSHLDPAKYPEKVVRGESILALRPDRVAMQDATAQMAILQFMQSGRAQTAVPSTVHCDHLIRAQSGVKEDMERAISENKEVYNFLRSSAGKYGMGFWQPGSGIIHQVVLEKYAFPGGLMIGTDSHTPNAGGLGMAAIGVGGSDAAETMSGLAWEVRAPKLVGVKLTGELQGWATPKDVITYLVGKLTTKGGTNKIIEYFGPGVSTINTTGKATITNMGAELGATTSIFPYDKKDAEYLRATGRSDIADLTETHAQYLKADPAVEADPSKYYDEVIEIDLSKLEPHVNGPHTPDLARPVSTFAEAVTQNDYPTKPSAALIGSCTNSSYYDLERVANLARQARAKGLTLKTKLFITPGSQQVLETIKQNGQLKDLTDLGATVLANACGPCIGNWDRPDMKPGERNAIVSSFNRNFPGRNDGRTETMSFLTSPDMVMLYALAGDMRFNPFKDTIDGVKLEAPTAPDIPPNGFAITNEGFIAPAENGKDVAIDIPSDSPRLEILAPFKPWDGQDFTQMPVLIKTKGKTTTDDISPAGPWLGLRGHLTGISYNMLLRAIDAETDNKAEPVAKDLLGQKRQVSPWALKAIEYRDNPAIGGSIIVGDENYGEGSSREHAAMSPRLLGVKAVIARSFARIHETNLKKQGILPFTFANPSDYDRIHKDDRLDIIGLKNLQQGQPVTAIVHAANGGASYEIPLNHSLTNEQVEWFKAGSAINAAASQPAMKS
jgi:aconitate hydratase